METNMAKTDEHKPIGSYNTWVNQLVISTELDAETPAKDDIDSLLSERRNLHINNITFFCKDISALMADVKIRSLKPESRNLLYTRIALLRDNDTSKNYSPDVRAD